MATNIREVKKIWQSNLCHWLWNWNLITYLVACPSSVTTVVCLESIVIVIDCMLIVESVVGRTKQKLCWISKGVFWVLLWSPACLAQESTLISSVVSWVFESIPWLISGPVLCGVQSREISIGSWILFTLACLWSIRVSMRPRPFLGKDTWGSPIGMEVVGVFGIIQENGCL